jgi:Alkylmercury lyase
VDELDLRIRNHVYGSFVEHGRVATPADVAAELGIGEEVVAQSFHRLQEAHALVLAPGSTAIRMLHPFSTVETAHRVEVAGRRWYANCAWDALGIPHALREDDARIGSRCPDCGDALELELRGGEIVRGADLLVHFVVPARRWWDDIGFT